jgi:hypothetical protein
MNEQRIVVEIDEQGGITADANGFTGGQCLKDLEKLLAGVADGSQFVQKKPDKLGKTALKTQTMNSAHGGKQ